MDQAADLNRGLATTSRQRRIFALYAVTMLVLCSGAIALRQRAGGYNLLPLLLLFAPWLLGVLVVLLDRPGPLRNWMGPLLVSLFYPCIALWYDGAALVAWFRLGHAPAWAFAVPFNALLLGGFLAYLTRVYPRRCPDCGQRSLVPFVRLGKKDGRTRQTRGCASCGVHLCKDDQGRWQHEPARI